MKTIKFLSIIMACLIVTFSASAQKVRNTSFKVSGECGMCKKKIETAARQAGASYASWSPETKLLKVTYNVSSTGIPAIQQTIANTGYDTPGFRAPDEAYNALEECCQYARDVKRAKCCSDHEMMKDGKCADMAVCKDKDVVKNHNSFK